MPWLTDLLLQVHPVLLMTLGRQGQSGAGVVSELMVHGNEGLYGKWQVTYSCSLSSTLIKKKKKNDVLHKMFLGRTTTHTEIRACRKKAKKKTNTVHPTETRKKWLKSSE